MHIPTTVLTSDRVIFSSSLRANGVNKNSEDDPQWVGKLRFFQNCRLYRKRYEIVSFIIYYSINRSNRCSIDPCDFWWKMEHEGPNFPGESMYTFPRAVWLISDQIQHANWYGERRINIGQPRPHSKGAGPSASIVWTNFWAKLLDVLASKWWHDWHETRAKFGGAHNFLSVITDTFYVSPFHRENNMLFSELYAVKVHL